METKTQLYLCNVDNYKFCISGGLVDSILDSFHVFPLVDAKDGVLGYVIQNEHVYFVVNLLTFFKRTRTEKLQRLICISSSEINLGILVHDAVSKNLQQHEYELPRKHGIIGECVAGEERYPLFNPLLLFQETEEQKNKT